MKIKSLILALGLMIALPAISRADEGMWLLNLIGKNYNDMQKQGFKLTPEDIYSINQNCIKDAIVGLGNAGSPFWHFCTGEIISDQGLMTTNHHCGYGQIQKHSTVAHDYLRDGFWAYSMDQELPNPGITASILIRVEDVTDQFKEVLSDAMTEAERAKAIREKTDEISKKAVEGTLYNATVKPMFDGNQFFLFVHIIYKDVRLVGAPPSSMGKFGGDTDNWSWPRHTCDFSMFRIYTAPDGSPAEYSADNVPLQPKHHLPVSIKELNDGDFAMVMGFPGTTNHFVTSYGLEEVMNITNKLRHEIRTVKINILREEMAASQETKIKYASKYASCSNYWKYSSEQNKALENLNTMQIKKDIERDFMNWAQGKDPKYRKSLDLIRDGYAARATQQKAQQYLVEGLLTGPELPFQAYKAGRTIMMALQQQDMTQRDAIIASIKGTMEAFYKDYSENTEKRLESAMFEYVLRHMDMDYCPAFLPEASKKYKGDFDKYVNDMFAKSIFANKDAWNKYISKKYDAKVIEKDPLFQIGKAIYEQYMTVHQAVSQESADNLQRGIRDFVDGILQMNDGKKLMSPDANSTIRLTYGNVKAYDPRDGVFYKHYTTMKGIIEKEQPSGEFAVPARLKELYEARDFGQYANKNGELPTCFITNNDITGGNSGSPVIDAKGNLIGLAFDGNGEAMSGDIDFEENLQRCICLDTRYMLWVIDKYAGAHNLIEEMTIVK
ncbi:MAG: S46 family peptidase [Bacteroidales bacterium]|nr:S46 family peptidase [Bacteroidales bacterium]